MANTLAFYNYIGGASQLALDYIEDQTHIPLPPHTKLWSGNITSEGSRYITGKYENIPISLGLKVTGTSKTDLDDDLQAIIAQITKENWLYFEPEGVAGGGGLYYHTFPYDSAEAHSYLSKAYRDAFVVHGFNITLMAEPFAYQAEQTITVVDNLVPNWNMEDFTGDDPDDWTVSEDVGCTVTQETTIIVYGESSVRLSADDVGETAEIETTAVIPITNSEHYCIVFNFRQYQVAHGPWDEIDCIITQYDGVNPIGGADITISPTVPAIDTWYSSTTVIHATGEGGNDWDANADGCKIKFVVTGHEDSHVGGNETTDFLIDGIAFSNTQTVSGNTLSQPLGIVIVPADIDGDVNTPCDIYLEKFSEPDGSCDVAETQGIHIGGRKEYSAGYVPYLEADSGTTAYSNISNQGSHKTFTLVSNLVLNPSLETWTGTAAAPNFGDWTETESANGIISASAIAKNGSWSLLSRVNNKTSPETNEIESTAYIAINIANDYEFSFWYLLFQTSGFCRLKPKIRCYSAVPALTGTLYPLGTSGTVKQVEGWAWEKCDYSITAAMWPALTTQCKIEFEMSGRRVGIRYDQLYIDSIRLYQSSVAHMLQGSDDLDDLKGFVKPFLHLKLAADQDDVALDLRGRLTDGANNITTNKLVAATNSWQIPSKFKYDDADLACFEIPTVRISDNASSAGYDQVLRLDISDLEAGSTPLSVDTLCLIPIDAGYCAIPAENNHYLIVDSQSKLPGVLTSYDGTLNKSAWYPQASVSRRFMLDPQNGTNLAILERYTVSDDTAGGKHADWLDQEMGQFLMNVSIKYKPRFLLAP